MRPREFDEGEVILGAMEAFWRKGYQSTSVQDLVDATGLQRGSLYGAFGDKRGLFLAALDRYAEHATGHLRALLGDADDPVEALRSFIRKAGEDAADPVASTRGCMLGNSCLELAAHDEEVRARADALVDQIRILMAGALRRGQAQGTFSPDRDPEAVATFIQCSLQGLAVLARSRPEPHIIQGTVRELLRALD